MNLSYQIHSHSQSCRKYKNIDCRYSFGRFFTDRTIIADPLPDHMSGDEKESILHKHNAILNVVKEYIDTYLNPRKVNILDPLKSDYVKPKDINTILLEIRLFEYNTISPKIYFQWKSHRIDIGKCVYHVFHICSRIIIPHIAGREIHHRDVVCKVNPGNEILAITKVQQNYIWHAPYRYK